jgi:hypothetical protein
VPAGLVAAGTALLLACYGVPLTTTATFAAYLVLGIVLPGTLLWRWCHRRGPFVADVAGGTALGYAVEVLTYLPARAVDLPYLVLVWPVATIVAFTLVPKLRRHWRSAPDAERAPASWSWAMAAAVSLLVFWSVKFFRVHGLRWPGYATPDTDSPFHLALLGEARHHMPMGTPWIAGEPLYYHWFVYAEMAATSWVTGIEAQVLLLRLSMLPMLAGFVVLVAALGRRLGGGWPAGAAVVAGTLFVLAPNPYGWQLGPFYTGLAFGPVDDGSVLRLTVWSSPSQTFGALLFAALMLVLVDLLEPGPARRWVVFGLLLIAVMGGKATFLPLLLAGLLLVVAVCRKVRPLIAAGMTLGALVFAQLVLFGGASQGLGWAPLTDVRTAGINTAVYLTKSEPWRLAVLTGLFVWCWCCVWAGVSGLLRHRRRLTEPAMVLLLGIGAAGIGATMLLGQSGDSQRFFLEAARPYLVLAAVCGLVAVLRRPGAGRLLAGAALAGALAIVAIRRLDGPAIPYPWRTGHQTFELLWPYGATAVVAVGAALGLAVARRRFAVLRGVSHALVIALLAGFGLASTYSNLSRVVRESAAQGWREVVTRESIVTAGSREAGRWLRDHSDPDDLVATNAHCLTTAIAEGCVNLHFAVAAYTERRVLVEGWGFSARAHERAEALGTWVGTVPYWRPDVLAANDAAFDTPSVETVSRLRDRYGVRWLFVDETAGVSGELWRFAELRFRAGDCAVYQVLRPGERM